MSAAKRLGIALVSDRRRVCSMLDADYHSCLVRTRGQGNACKYRGANWYHTGKPPALFIRTVRLPKAADLLKSTDMNISEIA